jgi:hypothetical protein
VSWAHVVSVLVVQTLLVEVQVGSVAQVQAALPAAPVQLWCVPQAAPAL